MTDKCLGGRFTLQEEVGGGAKSVVWKASEEMGHGISRDVAVKIIHGFETGDEQELANFQREARLLAQLGQHPNIVQTFTFDIEPGMGPWIAMEFLPRSANDVISAEPAEASVVRTLVHDVAMGLHHMHTSDPPIMHWDIKPANVLVCTHGYKIADFGVARSAGAAPVLSQASTRYAPPEVIKGEMDALTPSADLYSLGFVAYEMALGRSKFREQFAAVYDPDDPDGTAGDDTMKWMGWHCAPAARLRPVAEILPDFPRDLSDIIERLTAKPIEDRFASAQQVLESLGDVPRQAQAIPAAGQGPAAPAHKPDHRPWYTKPVPLAALAVLVLVPALTIVMMLALAADPVILLANQGSYTGAEPQVRIYGRVTDMPKAGTLVLATSMGSATELPVNEAGDFEHMFMLTELGAVDADLQVVRDGDVLVERDVVIERIPPSEVMVEITTDPPVPNGVVHALHKNFSRRLGQATLDANGRASLPVRYGDFAVSMVHDDFVAEDEEIIYETGYEPTRAIVLRTASMLRETGFSVDPPTATVAVSPRSALDDRTPVELDETGAGTTPLRIGDYQAEVSAEGYVTEQVRFTVGSHGEAEEVAVVLRPAGDVEQTSLGQAFPNLNILSGLEDIDTAILLDLSPAEFKAYIEMHAPLDSLVFEEDKTLNRLRVRGTVLSDAELQTLYTRMAAAEERLQFEVHVDPRDVCLRLQSALTAAGAEDVRVRPKKSGDDTIVHAEFTRTDDVDKPAAQAIAERYVFDRRLTRLVAY